MNIIKPLKAITSITALCSLLFIATAASVNASGYDVTFDSPRHHQRSGLHTEHGMKRMISALSLSEQQQLEIKTIKTQAKEQHKSLQGSMKQFRAEAKVLIHAKNFDEQAFMTLQAAYQPSFEQAGLAKAKTRNAIFNVLTLAQQEKWSKMMDNRQKRSNRN